MYKVYEYEYLENLNTLHQTHTSNLKLIDGYHYYLSRMFIGDWLEHSQCPDPEIRDSKVMLVYVEENDIPIAIYVALNTDSAELNRYRKQILDKEKICLFSK